MRTCPREAVWNIAHYMEALVHHLRCADLEIKTAETKPTDAARVATRVTEMRSELVRDSEDGEISQLVKFLKKASAKVIEKIHKQVSEKRLEKANAFISDMLLARFADVLGGLDAVESPEELSSDQQRDSLLRRDVERVVSYATPFLPFLGLLSGALTTGKHIYKHRAPADGE